MPASERLLAAATLANNRFLLAVNAEQLLVIHRRTFALQHEMQAAVTEPAAFSRQSQQTRAKRTVVPSPRAVAFGATPTSRQARRYE